MSVLSLPAWVLMMAGPGEGLEGQPHPFLGPEGEGLERASTAARIERVDEESFDWRAAERWSRWAPDGLRWNWDARVSEGSGSSAGSSWLESLGRRVGDRMFLGVTVDRLGFEEYDGGRVAILNPRHGTPRRTFLATGLGLTLGF